MSAAVQARLDLMALAGGVARFGSGPAAHSVAVLDVVGADATMASADDTTQDELLAGRAQFLNAQTAPFQVLVRAEPVDLDGHLRHVRARAETLTEPLAGVARDYVGFLQALVHRRTLLERHCYVVLPDQTAEVPALSLGRWLRRVVHRGNASDRCDDAETVPATLARRLGARCDLVARQLGRSGLHTRRLTSQHMAELLHRCWSAELSRAQRLREEIGAYTTLVVGSRTPVRGELEYEASAAQLDEAGPSTHRTQTDDQRLLVLGTRTLADLIAPSGCEVRRDHLRLDSQYARVLAVTAYPRLVSAGWLSLLVESDLPIELSLHVRPLSSADMVRALGLQLARLQSSRLAALRGERIADPEREIALEDAERLRDRLQRGEERLFAVSLYVPRNLDTSALAATLPFVGPSLAMDTGMLVGVARVGQAPVLLDPFDRSLDNANLAVVAPAGAGKSFFCKLLALRQLINGTECLVIDPEGEYGGIAEAVDGQVVRLAASSPHRLNPFDLPPPVSERANPGAAGGQEEEDPLAERVTALLGLLEVMLCQEDGKNISRGALNALERAVLDRAIYRTYARVGITADPTTHGRPAPLLRDLHTVLADTTGEIAGSLAVRLERYVEGSLSAGLFAGPTNVALDRSLVVFNLQQLEDELRPLAIHLIAGFVWTRVRRDRRPRLLFIDEAWSLLRFPEGGAFVAAMARRARKYYLGLVTITQQVGDLADGGHGETILTNAAQVLLLKQKADTIDAATARFRLTPDERQVLLGADKGEGLLLVRGNRIPLQIVASQAEYRLATTSPRDLDVFSPPTTTTPRPAQAGRRAPEPGETGSPSSVGAILAARRHEKPGPPTNNGHDYASGG